MSALLDYINKKERKFYFKLSDRINKFYDQVYIDEFQDFRKFDYDLLMNLARKINNILLVGDFYQHSVSGLNNSGKPFKANKKYILYDEFLKEIEKLGFKIDTSTLTKSRRCSEDVCDFISKKLGIKICSAGIEEGKIIQVTDDLRYVLDNQEIVKLVYSKAKNYKFKAMNWSYSKGSTFDNICVILTDQTSSILDPDFDKSKLPTVTLNKLYVALTRSRGSVYLVKDKDFKKIKSEYTKES